MGGGTSMRAQFAVYSSTLAIFIGTLVGAACPPIGGPSDATTRKKKFDQPEEPEEPEELEDDPASPPGSLALEPLPPIFDRITGRDLVPDLVVDPEKAVVLGKALFWDMQAGSDGQACASCHFSAGADPRARHQLSPGPAGGNGQHDPTRSGGGGPNYELTADDFPFHALVDPEDRDSEVLFDTDDVTSSQGVIRASFTRVTADNPADVCEVQPDEVFQVGGKNMRRVEPRNAPTVINAGYNFRNFWDGRANNVFNGLDPFGDRNPDAFVLEVQNGLVVRRKIALVNASLASQATGPLLNDFEMSCAGRGFHDVARKLLAEGRKPLALQEVAPDDSVLGPYADPGGAGLTVGYGDLIREAFAPKLWDSEVRLDAQKQLIGNPSVVPPEQQFTLMESNFSLFWGLAIMLYELTLVSADSPFDMYMDGRDPGALGAGELAGLDVFMNEGKCVECHGTAMFTNASTLHLLSLQEGLVERMSMSPNARHYAATTNTPISVYPPVKWGKAEVPGAHVLSFHVEATPTVAKNKIVPGAAEGTIELASGDAVCAYAPTTMTLGADNLPTRDALIEANLVAGSGCEKKIRIELVDDVEDGPGTWIDLVKVYNAGNKEMFAGAAYAWGATIREPTLYDSGFYNIGVRPSAEDLGVGGLDPFGNPLSYTVQFVRKLLGEDVPDVFEVDPCRFEIPWSTTLDGVLFPGGFTGLTNCGGAPAVSTGLPAASDANLYHIGNLPTAVDGAFKTPTLRNVQVTAPYMHNGGMATLEQVVEFYNRGGDHRNPELAPAITPLGLTPEQRANLVLFLESLTDPNVVYECPPFDHPQLFVPRGLDTVADVDPVDGVADEDLLVHGLEIPAVGASCREQPISTFLYLEDGELPPKP